MKTTRRGSTLLETMIAASVLLLGMVGVVQLMISGVTQNSISNARATAQELATSGLGQAMSMPFDAVPVGTWDAGILFDNDGRRFGRIMVVADVGDGGVRARQVTIRTEYRDILGAMSLLRTAQSTVIISEIPDAGL